MSGYQPLVSCIIPVYNAEKYLTQGIESLLTQTHKNIEIILVDDQSTDNSWKICQEYAEKHKNVKAYKLRNNSGAPLRGRERGIKESSGEWITFMDCDDYVSPVYIENLLKATNKGQYDIAVTGHSRLHPDGEVEDFSWDDYSQTKKERMKSFYEHYFVDQDYWTDPTDTVGQHIIKAEVAKKTDFSKYPNTIYGEDSIMALAFLNNSSTGVNFVDNHDFFWRQRPGSGSHGGFSMTANRPELYRAFYEIFSQNNLLPLVSIIIPVYKVERYLASCIDSVLAQTYPHIEVILVDDKSPDNSGAIADRYAKEHERVRVIHKKKNEGLNLARHTGLEASLGEYVLFLDSDDLLTDNCVETALRTLLQDETDFVRFGMLTFKSEKDLAEKITVPREEKKVLLKGKKDLYMTQFDQAEVLGGMPMFSMTVCGVLYTTSSLKKINWNETNYRAYEDNVWTLRFLENVSSGTYLSYIGYLYRFDDSITDVLNKSLVGNSFNGKPIGYMECWSYIWNEYRRYNKKYNINADEIVERMIRHLFTFRASHITKAGLWSVEGNDKYLQEAVRVYQERLDEVRQENAQKDVRIRTIEVENEHLMNELDGHLSIKRSAKLTLGNIKRRVNRHRKAQF